MTKKKNYYDWDKTLSYAGARTYAVFGAKNIGKTFGLRLKSIERYLKTGLRMCEIERTKAGLANLSNGYFIRLQNDGFFTNYEFKTTENDMMVKRPGNENFELMGHFVAITDLQQVKKRSVICRGNLIFDEAVIDSRNLRFHQYLTDEVSQLANIVDSITRENEFDKKTQTAKLFLLGNACDLHTPYLEWLGVKSIPEKYGYQWCRNKTALFHYPAPENIKEKIKYTLAGQMLAGSEETEMVFENKFNGKNEITFVSEKTAQAKIWGGIVYKKVTFGLWIDYNTGVLYINRNIPKNLSNIMYLTDSDGNIEFKAVAKNSTFVKILKELYYGGSVRYDSLSTKGMFYKILNFIGVQ